jgi:hypothetical protein
VPRHRSSTSPSTAKAGAALTLFSRTFTRMLAAVLVLVGLYSLLQTPSSPTVQAAGSDGALTVASKVQADEEEDEDDGGQADEQDEGRASGDGAAARARPPRRDRCSGERC